MKHIKPGQYKHFKGGLYQVEELAQHSETLEHFVVYRALYGEGGLWIRPLSMFTEVIERGGEKFPRFEFISDQ